MKGKTFVAFIAVLVFSLGIYAAAAAAPTDIIACGSISAPGSYKLANNLTAPTGDCLVVGADDVTIDLDGFTISGNPLGAGISVDPTAGVLPTGLVIRNGTITGFGIGIAAPSAFQAVVERMRLINNTSSAVAMGGLPAVVKDSVFLRNGTGPIVGPFSVVSGNSVSNSASGNGITAGQGSTVNGNTVSNNTGDGIAVGVGSSVANNTASQNTGAGIRATCPSTILGNTGTNNAFNQNLVLMGAAVDCNSNLFEHNVFPIILL